MAIFLRIILVLAFALQSASGLATVNCGVAMPKESEALADASAAVDASCACCDGSMAAGCPTGDRVIACRCGRPQDENPRIPALPSTTQTTPQFVAPPSVLLTCLVAEHPSPLQRPTSAAGRPKRSGNSIQSLLCTWVV